MTALDTAQPAGKKRPILARRELVVLMVAAACLQAIAWVVLLALFSTGRMGYGLHQLADTILYQFYASSFTLGRWPYADTPVEYPPLANLVFLLAPSGGSVAEYERWFSTAMIVVTTGAAVLTTAAAALTWRSIPRGLAVGGVYAVLTLCCGALPLNRYDAVVALTLAATLFLLVVRRPVPAAVSLGLGFALKLTPALLLPLLALLQQSRRRLFSVLIGFVVAAALPFVPFLLHDPVSTAQPFTYHARRPLQLESVPATPWSVAALAGWAHPRIDSSYGSQNYTGEVPDAVAKLSPWVLLATVAAVYVLIWRRRAVLRGSLGAIPIAALALLLVAICASKVLSPQFLIWTFPVVALCAAQTRWLPRAAALAVGVATALTQLGFPVRYWDLVALESAPLAILVARNLTLLTAAALAIAALVTLPDVEGATSTS